MSGESSRQVQVSGAGRIGNALMTSAWAKPIRKLVNVTVPEHIENIKATVQDARSKIASLRSDGYEVVEFEKGQERAQAYHLFRFHSYMILKMRKGDGEHEQICYTRVEWAPQGIVWGPREENDIGGVASGVLYPHLRRQIEVADPSTALRRLDRVIMEEVAKQEQDRRFSVADFNSGHFANLVEQELQMPTPDALIPPTIAAPKCDMEQQRDDQRVEIVEIVADATGGSGDGGDSQVEVAVLYPTGEPLYTVPESVPLDTAEEAGLVLAQPVLTIENLEASDKDGNRCEIWCRSVAGQVQSRGAADGHTVAKPPKESILGQGNYGCVWRAKDPKTGEFYAVKNMREADATREVQLFHHLHEKAAHPCIVRLYHCQVFPATKLCTMIMEFCAGGDLQIACQSERKASITEGRQYFAPLYTDIWLGQVLLALEHLHLETQCLIRDLKPANVLLDAGGQCAKLADFGLGRVGVESAGKWTLGGPTGTPGYVSPEILMKERYDFRADLYSYGVMMWVMATGGITQYQAPQPPSNARQMRGGDFHVLNEDWRLLHDTVSKADGGGIAPPVQGRQRDVILSLTARNPRERPDHAGVRAHAFFAELGLPDKGAPEDAVRAWSSRQIDRIQASMD